MRHRHAVQHDGVALAHGAQDAPRVAALDHEVLGDHLQPVDARPPRRDVRVVRGPQPDTRAEVGKSLHSEVGIYLGTRGRGPGRMSHAAFLRTGPRKRGETDQPGPAAGAAAPRGIRHPAEAVRRGRCSRRAYEDAGCRVSLFALAPALLVPAGARAQAGHPAAGPSNRKSSPRPRRPLPQMPEPYQPPPTRTDDDDPRTAPIVADRLAAGHRRGGGQRRQLRRRLRSAGVHAVPGRARALRRLDRRRHLRPCLESRRPPSSATTSRPTTRAATGR